MTTKVLWLAALALPLMLAGLWLGSRHFAGATPESFRRSILRLLIVDRHDRHRARDLAAVDARGDGERLGTRPAR